MLFLAFAIPVCRRWWASPAAGIAADVAEVEPTSFEKWALVFGLLFSWLRALLGFAKEWEKTAKLIHITKEIITGEMGTFLKVLISHSKRNKKS